MILNKLSLLFIRIGIILYSACGFIPLSAQATNNGALYSLATHSNRFITTLINPEVPPLFAFLKEQMDQEEYQEKLRCTPDIRAKYIREILANYTKSPVKHCYLGYSKWHNQTDRSLWWAKIIICIHQDDKITGWFADDSSGDAFLDGRTTPTVEWESFFKGQTTAFVGNISNGHTDFWLVDQQGNTRDEEGFSKFSGESDLTTLILKGTWNIKGTRGNKATGPVQISLIPHIADPHLIEKYISNAVELFEAVNTQPLPFFTKDEIMDFDIGYYNKLQSATQDPSVVIPLQFGIDPTSGRHTLKVAQIVTQTNESVRKRTNTYPAPAALTPELIDDFRMVDIAHEVLGHGIINRHFANFLRNNTAYEGTCMAEGLAVCIEYSILKELYKKRNWNFQWRDVQEYVEDVYDKLDTGMNGNARLKIYSTGVRHIINSYNLLDANENIDWNKLRQLTDSHTPN